jgi:hypothetical protein
VKGYKKFRRDGEEKSGRREKYRYLHCLKVRVLEVSIYELKYCD